MSGLGGAAGVSFNNVLGDDLMNYLVFDPADKNPGLYNGGILWYDFTNTGGMYQDQAGTNLVSTNDQYIRHVKNKMSWPYFSSLTNANGTFSTAGQQMGQHMISLADNDTTAPQYKTNVHNGLSAAYFDGDAGIYCSGNSTAEGASLLPVGCFFCGLSSRTFSPNRLTTWIVFKASGTSISSDETLLRASLPTSAIGCSTTSGAFLDFKIESSDDDIEFRAGPISGGADSPTVFPSNQNMSADVELYTTCMRDDSGNDDIVRIYKNGDTSAGTSGNTECCSPSFTYYAMNLNYGSTGGNCMNWSIGCSVNLSKAFSEHFTGHIFEILILKGSMSDAQRVAIDNYFKSKYSL
tara:strand:+ start:800 stop:1852 length:1053 start_codon:yes stop_codon:yes gene_type:complete